MSLVFDALRHVEAAAGGAMAASAPTPVASRRPRRAWALSVAAALPAVALAGYLLAGAGEAGAADPVVAGDMAQVDDAAGSASWTAEADGLALVDLTRAAAPVSSTGAAAVREIVAPRTPEAAAVQVAVPVAAGADDGRAEIHAAAPGQHSSVLPAAPPMTAAEPAGPVLSSAAAPMPAERPPGRISIEVTRGGRATAGAPPADAASVRPTVAAIERAVAAGDVAAAELHLDALSGLLHEDSLTLLRMRAWVASVRGDADEAELGYRRILQRVPDDANAAVNVARFEAGRGEIDSARGRLTRLSGRHPGSAQVRGAMAELEAMAR
ncbi:tetratricopeptide repeat protein [Luteimonas sp. SJ-92]|uniref:Tetratricopeptide repeat protein n=1 Tax=Luteimonas salinisoli TaxID=2752307 RepID=A0A853J7S5_9GAMM|nr:tetratricopeptide repeat protein [Luteimonas salinisoli]NZA24812.1 tetratricopeptide repeat protein [Luteimonas salinisoli]